MIDKANGNYYAYAPDVAGCAATGATLEEVMQHIQEALTFHFEGLQEDKLPIPEPTSYSDWVEVDSPALTAIAICN
jgi:predicted RNase H-like HicB family nuclease